MTAPIWCNGGTLAGAVISEFRILFRRHFWGFWLSNGVVSWNVIMAEEANVTLSRGVVCASCNSRCRKFEILSRQGLKRLYASATVNEKEVILYLMDAPLLKYRISYCRSGRHKWPVC